MTGEPTQARDGAGPIGRRADDESPEPAAVEPAELAERAGGPADARQPSPAAGPGVADAADPEPRRPRPPPTQTPPARRTPPAPTPAGAATGRPNRRKVREGLVLSVAMDKTAVVGVIERVRHPRYAKTVQRTKRLYAHDPNNDLRVGDRVRLAETRPLSKLKRWRVVDVLERAK